MIHIIIVAAGRGSRFGSELPKQFVPLGDMPVVLHTLSRLRDVFPQASYTIVLSEDFVDFLREACARHSLECPRIVLGGATRAESVRNAISAISAEGVADGDVVMIHDGARPVVPAEMLKRIADAISDGAEAVIPVVPVTDSLRSVGESGCRLPFKGESEVADRSRLVAVQTPQAFRADAIVHAYSEAFSPALTDDASVYQAYTGRSPVLVEGSPLNIKITNPRDIDIAALYMK